METDLFCGAAPGVRMPGTHLIGCLSECWPCPIRQSRHPAASLPEMVPSSERKIGKFSILRREVETPRSAAPFLCEIRLHNRCKRFVVRSAIWVRYFRKGMQRHRFDLSHPQFGLRYKRDRFYFMLTDFESSVRVRVENLEQDAYNIYHNLKHINNMTLNRQPYELFACKGSPRKGPWARGSSKLAK